MAQMVSDGLKWSQDGIKWTSTWAQILNLTGLMGFRVQIGSNGITWAQNGIKCTSTWAQIFALTGVIGFNRVQMGSNELSFVQWSQDGIEWT